MLTTNSKKGDCYKASWLYVTTEDLDATLVHGKITHLNQQCKVNHAWVEKNNRVIEVSNGASNIFEKEKYYGL